MNLLHWVIIVTCLVFPVDEVALLEGQHVEEGAEVAAVVDLVADEGAPLLALGLRDAIWDHPRHRRVRIAFEKAKMKIKAFLVPTLAGQVYNRLGEFISLPALTLAPPVSMTKVADGSVTGILSVGAFFEPKPEIL